MLLNLTVSPCGRFVALTITLSQDVLFVRQVLGTENNTRPRPSFNKCSNLIAKKCPPLETTRVLAKHQIGLDGELSIKRLAEIPRTHALSRDNSDTITSFSLCRFPNPLSPAGHKKRKVHFTGTIFRFDESLRSLSFQMLLHPSLLFLLPFEPHNRIEPTNQRAIEAVVGPHFFFGVPPCSEDVSKTFPRKMSKLSKRANPG